MPKQVSPLSHTQVQAAKPRPKVYNLSDGYGLSLRVKPSGSKSWLFNYIKPASKKRAFISFGIFPDVSLRRARKMRINARTLLLDHIDPQQQRMNDDGHRKQDPAHTLRAIFYKWLETRKKSLTPRYISNIEKSFIAYVFPTLGEMCINDITSPIAIKALGPLSEQEKYESIRRTCGRLNQVMNFAVNSGLIESNRITSIKDTFPAPQVNNFPSIKPEAFKALLAELKTIGMKTQTRNLLMFQLHTMVRPNEAARAEWKEIDLKNGTWTIPSDKMKRRKDHIIILSKQAITLIKSQMNYRFQSSYVFPSYIDTAVHMSTEAVNNVIKKSSFKGKVVSHGFRTLASTILNENRHDPELIEVALAHSDKNKVRAVYNRADYIEPRRVMMQWWSDYIDEMNDA